MHFPTNTVNFRQNSNRQLQSFDQVLKTSILPLNLPKIRIFQLRILHFWAKVFRQEDYPTAQNLKQQLLLQSSSHDNTAYTVTLIHSFIHFWQAPLRVCSAERRHQSKEWAVLSQVNHVVHIEVAGFQILLNGFHPCNTRTSQIDGPQITKHCICCCTLCRLINSFQTLDAHAHLSLYSMQHKFGQQKKIQWI